MTVPSLSTNSHQDQIVPTDSKKARGIALVPDVNATVTRLVRLRLTSASDSENVVPDIDRNHF